MKIYFAGDHAGFEFKKEVIDFVKSLGHETEDLGPFEYNALDDYPDYVIPLAKRVAEGKSTEVRGIVVAGSGQGEMIAMNRIKGARSALLCPQGEGLIKASRDHNDSNILSIGARFLSLDEIKKGIKLWLQTPFSNDERHIRRLEKIEEIYKT